MVKKNGKWLIYFCFTFTLPTHFLHRRCSSPSVWKQDVQVFCQGSSIMPTLLQSWAAVASISHSSLFTVTGTDNKVEAGYSTLPLCIPLLLKNSHFPFQCHSVCFLLLCLYRNIKCKAHLLYCSCLSSYLCRSTGLNREVNFRAESGEQNIR